MSLDELHCGPGSESEYRAQLKPWQRLKLPAGRGLAFKGRSLPRREHPLSRFAGILKDEPLYGPWQESIRRYRQAADQDFAES